MTPSFRSWCAALLAWSTLAAGVGPVLAQASSEAPIQNPSQPRATTEFPADTPIDSLPYRPSLDPTSTDPSVDACVDFYRYSCGGWIEHNPIPPDQAGWSVFAKLQDENLRFLWGLLIAAAEPRAGRPAHVQKAGDYFASCMREPADDRGAAALAGPLAAVDRFGSARTSPALANSSPPGMAQSLAQLVAQLHALGADQSLFQFGAEPDHADSTRMIALADAGGLGLPDRDDYLKRDARTVALRRAYQAHIARTLALAGADAATAQAGATNVLRIETALAKDSLAPDQRRDPRRIYHRMSLAQLQRLTPAFDWRAYFAASGVPAQTPINVAEPLFFGNLNRLLASRPAPQWATYLRWHLLRAESPYLSAPFAQAHFDFYGRTLEGVLRMPPRWKTCVEWVDHDLGEALGQLFVERTFAASTRQRVKEMTSLIETAMRERIEALDWMSASTKQAALEKLGAIVNKVGYPERWRDYAALAIDRDDFLGNVQRSAAFERRRELAKLGEPVDRREWSMTPPTVNAYYDAQMNDINFPAGVLQPPLFDPDLDDAPNYGNTGATIGHELTHGFDDEGRQFDAGGNLRDWWTRKDAAAFNRRAQCVVDQYSKVTVIDDIKQNGHLTLGEDVADLGGAVLAYAAWKAATAGQALAPRDGLAPEQRFFVGMAQWACGAERPERTRTRAPTDPHSPARERVNGVVVNMPEFARAFACKPGQPMVSEQPCKVW